MRLKWFKGSQLPEVMRQVRRDLGDEAVILHTRMARRGLRGLLRRGGVEVLAAVDEEEAPRAVVTPAVEPPRPTGERALDPSAQPVSSRPAPPLTAEVAELRRLLIRVGGARALPSALESFYTWLLAAGLDEELAFGALDGLPTVDAEGRALEPETIGGRVEDRVMGLVRVAGVSTTPPRGVVAFVGPAGAGKTATSAKLAVSAHVAAARARVVSLDGINLGASGYLDALASASGVTCALAVTAPHLVAVMGRRWSGLTVIDTPGVSPHDAGAVAALAELLRIARPAEVHLVLPAIAKPDDALAAVRGLAPLGLTHVAFTRLDEAATCGSLVTVCARAGLPLSYVSSGRDIPNDLTAATARGLVRRVLRGEPHP